MLALKEFRLAGVDLKKGDAVPADAWQAAGERNRRAMKAGRFVMSTDDQAPKPTLAAAAAPESTLDPLRCPVARCQGRVLKNLGGFKTHMQSHVDKGEYMPPQEH